jgi:hypothetical protein
MTDNKEASEMAPRQRTREKRQGETLIREYLAAKTFNV